MKQLIGYKRSRIVQRNNRLLETPYEAKAKAAKNVEETLANCEEAVHKHFYNTQSKPTNPRDDLANINLIPQSRLGLGNFRLKIKLPILKIGNLI